MSADLFHYPMSCSTALRIAGVEAEVPLNVIYVDIYKKMLADGSSYFDHNPMGQVAALRTGEGDFLTENISILLWITRHANAGTIDPISQSAAYDKLVQWVSFCATELHKHIAWPIFRSDAPDEVKNYARSFAPQALGYVDQHLEDQNFLLGTDFCAADAYLTWFLALTRTAGIDISPYKNLKSYLNRAQSRPKVAAILSEDMQALMEDVQINGKRNFVNNPDFIAV